MKPKVIICHAYKTPYTDNWYQWLEANLVERGYSAEALDFPNISAPSEEEWVETIKNAHEGGPTVLVGHSLGCRAILAYLNQYKVNVDSIVLVGCPQYWEGIVDTRPPLKNYVVNMQEIDFDLVKGLVNDVHLFHGTNDPILSLKDLEFLKEQFGEKAHVYTSDTYGHYDVEEIPELLALFPE